MFVKKVIRFISRNIRQILLFGIHFFRWCSFLTENPWEKTQRGENISIWVKLTKPILSCTLLLLCSTTPLEAKTFKVASYNVENLFDITKDGTEYTEYIPNTGYGWNREIFEIKVANIAEVIKDLQADIVALQEVESRKALIALRNKLKVSGKDYPYWEIADSKSTAIKSAVLSKFPIVEKKEIQISGKFARSILRVTLDIDGNLLVLFINHWKSKRGPESRRVAYAKKLKQETDKLKNNADFILIGDFNSNYNEYETFKSSSRLNDTAGITGINHILQTVKGSSMVNETVLTEQTSNEYLYNLWLELKKTRRWSYNFFGDKNSLDNIILSRGFYDDKGISYVDNSFDKFDPDYLFKNNALYRWQRAKSGRGKHLGEGYSDHLPVFAVFSTDPFRFSADSTPAPALDNTTFLEVKEKSIADLYTSRVGNVNYRLKKCAVIYKHKNNAIIKQKNGRAVFLYKAGGNLEYGKLYNLTVTVLYDFHGLREITEIRDIKQTGKTINVAPYLLGSALTNLSEPGIQNEVISEIEGIYKRGYFYYGDNLKIKLYFKDKKLKPKNGSKVSLKHVIVGYYKHPQLVIEKTGQIRRIGK